MGLSSLKPTEREGKSWTVTSEGYRYSGEVRVVINIVLVRARISLFYFYLFPYRQFRRSNSVNVCLNKQDLLFPAKFRHNTEGNQTQL